MLATVPVASPLCRRCCVASHNFISPLRFVGFACCFPIIQGLPDRDYYFDEDKEEKRIKYKEHVARMLYLLDQHLEGDGKESRAETDGEHWSKAAAEQIYQLELDLASSHMTKTENRDPDATYNKMGVEALVDDIGKGKFDFGSYFVGMGKPPSDLGNVNVRNKLALKKVAEVLSEVKPQTLRHYLRWHAVSSTAPYLAKAFVEEDFDFFERTLSGTDEIKQRWKRAMAWTERALGEVLGKLYCRKYFDEECKERALKIVEQVRQALQERLKEVDWMKADSTRQMALKKMQRFNVKIGYPNKWIDYTNLQIDPSSDDFLSMIFKAREFHHNRDVKDMNDKVDREKWCATASATETSLLPAIFLPNTRIFSSLPFRRSSVLRHFSRFMFPQTVNAYYHPNLNEIVFPAAILQHPFFDKDADDAVNFGAMGAVVGT